MPKVPSPQPAHDNRSQAERLPLRWVVIALLAIAAGAVGQIAVGPVAAITTACAVATALHRIIA